MGELSAGVGRVETLTGIPAGQRMLCCSNTHFGPVIYVIDDAASPARRTCLDRLVESTNHRSITVCPPHLLSRGRMGCVTGRSP